MEQTSQVHQESVYVISPGERDRKSGQNEVREVGGTLRDREMRVGRRHQCVWSSVLEAR